MNRWQLFVVVLATLTCALLVAGIVDTVAYDPPVAIADGSQAGAGSPTEGGSSGTSGTAAPFAPFATAPVAALVTTSFTGPAITATSVGATLTGTAASVTATTVPASPTTSARPATTVPATTAPAPTAPVTTATTAPAPTTTTTSPDTLPAGLIQPYYQVVSAVDTVHALEVPGGAVLQTFRQMNEVDELTTLPVVGSTVTPDGVYWYQVQLRRRPNGITGWVRSEEVTAHAIAQAIVVQLAAHTVTLYDGGEKVASYPVCIGSTANPTPTGSFFALGVIEPSATGPYGPFAIPSSAFSDTLTDWPGGGVVGIHGTNHPESIGKSISHGCVRMYNKDITALALGISPGTPIFILP